MTIRPLRPAPFVSAEALRTEGLGLFAQLTDQRIIHILESLTKSSSPSSPSIFLPLLQVSHAWHQFAAWEPLWRRMAENLSGGDFDFEHSWRFTVRKVMAKKSKEKREKASGAIEAPLALVPTNFTFVSGFYSSKMYRRWFRAQCNLNTFEIDTGYIKRVANLSMRDFVETYDRPRMPVVLTDVVYKWQAYVEWNPKRMVERFGDVIVKIAQGTQYGKRIHMTMAQYWHYAHSQRDEKPLYVFDPSFEKRMPQLMEEFAVPRLFWQDYFSLLGSHRPNYRWLVMGPARSGTGFHIDPNGTSAWNALLCGRKRWAFYPPTMYPPGVTIGLHPDGQLANFEAPDPLKWYFEIYPHLPLNMRPIEVIQRAGDMLYVPAGWWHMVLNLDDTVSVTQNFTNKRNTVRFLYRQGDLQMLHVWMDRIKEIDPKLWSRMNKKLKILDGTQARVSNQFMANELHELKKEKRRAERSLKGEIRELKKKLGIEVPQEEEEDESEETEYSDDDDGSGEEGSDSDDSDEGSSDSANDY